MKTNVFVRKMLGSALCLLLLAPAALMAQKKMPITTPSEEARALFIEGKTHLERFERTKAIELLDKAIELDPFLL
jgi:hypothetical protein